MNVREAVFAPLRVRLRAGVADGPLFEGTPCWEWQGRRLPAGYGQISVAGTFNYTHRLAWEAFRGPIPEGFQIDHRCRNTCCCNVAHSTARARAARSALKVTRSTGPTPTSVLMVPRPHRRHEREVAS